MCSRSVSANTPSKSKTMALMVTPALVFVADCKPLTRPDGDGQTVFARRHRANVARVEQTVRMIRAIEVEIVQTRRRAIELQKASAFVRLAAAGEVAERQEEALEVVVVGGERRELVGGPRDRETERADLPILVALLC